MATAALASRWPAAPTAKERDAALKAEAKRARALEAAAQAASRDEMFARRRVEMVKNDLRSLERQQATTAHTYTLYKATRPLYDALENAVAAARSVPDVLAALSAAVSAQKEKAEADAAALDAFHKSGEANIAKMAELSAARDHSATKLKQLKELVKNPRNLPRPVALSSWYANNRDEVQRVRRNATMAGENASGVALRYFSTWVWPSPEFLDTRRTAEADHATNAADFYEQLKAAKAPGAKRNADEALGGAAAPAECFCCLAAPAVIACADGHANYCVGCLDFLLSTLRPQVLAGTQLLEGGVDDPDTTALETCCASGCGRKLQVRDAKARILATLGGSSATLAEVQQQELLYAQASELAARSAAAQLQRELEAKVGEHAVPELAEAKAHIQVLINVVSCPNCKAAYYGVTDACQHAFCTCRKTPFCAYCFQDHSDYDNCVLYPRYAEDDDDVAAPEDLEGGGAGLAPQNRTRVVSYDEHKAAAARVMKAHHINRVLASASSATIRAVLADADVLAWLREIHVTVNAAVCDAEASDEITACPLNIDGIGAYVCNSIRRAFQQTFQACRNKPYANNHELDTLMRRANEAERAAERAAALRARLEVLNAPLTAANVEARLDQLRLVLSGREAGTFPFRLPRSIAAARAAFAACTVGMGGETRRALKAKLDELAEQCSAAFLAYKAQRDADRMSTLRDVINDHVRQLRRCRRSLQHQAKGAPERLRVAQRNVEAAEAHLRAQKQSAAAARALRDASLAGQSSAAALPAVAAAVAAAAARERQNEPQEQRERFIVRFRFNAAAMTTSSDEEGVDDDDEEEEEEVDEAMTDSGDEAEDEEAEEEQEEETPPPRQRRRLWQPAGWPGFSSEEDEEAHAFARGIARVHGRRQVSPAPAARRSSQSPPPRVRRRFRRQAMPVDGYATAEEDVQERRLWSPADTPEPSGAW